MRNSIRCRTTPLPSPAAADTQEAFANERVTWLSRRSRSGWASTVYPVSCCTGMPSRSNTASRRRAGPGARRAAGQCAVHVWRRLYDGKPIVEKSAAEAGPGRNTSARGASGDMNRHCCGSVCRHRVLVETFRPAFGIPNCGACDICQGNWRPIRFDRDAEILSCVAGGRSSAAARRRWRKRRDDLRILLWPR